VRKLWSGISSEVTDATRTRINRFSQFFWVNSLAVPNPLSMCPVLAEKAVKGTSVIENGKILKTILWTWTVRKSWISSTRSPRADPIGYTIGGQSIIIPTDISLPRGDTAKGPVYLSPQATIAPASLWNLTPIDTDLTWNARCLARRDVDQLKWASGATMGFFNERFEDIFSRAKAIQTDRKGLG